MLKLIIGVLGAVGASLLLILMLYTSIKTLTIIAGAAKGKRKEAVKNTRYINLIEFVKWVLIDLRRGKSYFKLYGIWCFTGYYGQGKTLGAVNFAKHLQRKYPEKGIKIYSNFNIKGQVRKLEKWEDMLTLPENSIVIFDEIQSTFTSNKWADFPLELLWKLTQCRKQGLAVFCTSPVYNRMTIQLRESCDYVIECQNRLGLDRWFSYSFYHAAEYEKYREERGLKLLRARQFNYVIVAQDANYNEYDTYEQVERWDIVGEKDMPKRDYTALKNELIKEIERKIKKVS